MDALLTAAAHALDQGDVLAALKRVALRSDAPALAIRGVALARLGDFERARELLQAAARAFGAKAPLQRARCQLADAEIALATRDLRDVETSLVASSRALSLHGDRVNATHAECLRARSLLLRGCLAEAKSALSSLTIARAPALLEAEIELAWADLYRRELDSQSAQQALARAQRVARRADIPELEREVAQARGRLAEPVARLIRGQSEQLLRLPELAAVLAQPANLVVDARELVARRGSVRVTLTRRPVLFALLRALSAAWPEPVTRGELILRAFASTRANESHRMRLRVEIARLRRALGALADVRATPQGFRLNPTRGAELVLLARVLDDEHASLLALLGDGEAWSSSALALALGASQRSVQRALLTLQSAGKVRSVGRARAQRWLEAPSDSFATTMSLPGAALVP